MNTDPAAEPSRATILGMGWRGIALIGAFWTLFGAAMTASLFWSPLPRSGEASPAALVAFTFFGAYTWAVLTLPLFQVTQRLGLTDGEGVWRAGRVASLLVIGVVLSVLVSLAVSLSSWLLLADSLGGRLAAPEGRMVIFRYRLTHDLLACNLVLVASVARDYFFRYRSRLAEATLLRSQLAEARLQVLRTQINPHFLFNTLNAVAALVQTDPKGVRRMIALLSDLLRQSLDSAAEPEVPLARELELLRRYLSIMEIRFRGRLETRVSAEPDVMNALVPHFILQPLVENSMKHGIDGSENGTVDVSASRRNGELILRVIDTGAGRGAARPDRVAFGGSGDEGGFGLRHTRERLNELYGDAGSLELATLANGGTSAEVRIPFHTDRP